MSRTPIRLSEIEGSRAIDLGDIISVQHVGTCISALYLSDCGYLSLSALADDVCSDQTLVRCLLQETDAPSALSFADKLPDVNSSEAPATAATK